MPLLVPKLKQSLRCEVGMEVLYSDNKSVEMRITVVTICAGGNPRLFQVQKAQNTRKFSHSMGSSNAKCYKKSLCVSAGIICIFFPPIFGLIVIYQEPTVISMFPSLIIILKSFTIKHYESSS